MQMKMALNCNSHIQSVFLLFTLCSQIPRQTHLLCLLSHLPHPLHKSGIDTKRPAYFFPSFPPCRVITNALGPSTKGQNPCWAVFSYRESQSLPVLVTTPSPPLFWCRGCKGSPLFPSSKPLRMTRWLSLTLPTFL